MPKSFTVPDPEGFNLAAYQTVYKGFEIEPTKKEIVKLIHDVAGEGEVVFIDPKDVVG